jgi:hypothetical protein
MQSFRRALTSDGGHAADLISSVAHSDREVRGLMDESQWIGVRSPEFRTTEFLTSLEGVLACH